MAAMQRQTGKWMKVLYCVRFYSGTLSSKLYIHEKANKLLTFGEKSTTFPNMPQWFLNVRNGSSYSGNRQDQKVILHVNSTHDYLRRNEKFARTTYRNYDQMVHLLGLEVDLFNQNSLCVHLLKKLGCCSLDQPAVNTEVFVRYLQVCDGKLIRYLSRQELLALMVLLVNWDVPPSGLLANIITTLDMECARRVTLWNCDTCLLAVDLWVAWLGHKATKRPFFAAVLREWQFLSGSRQNLPHYLVQLLYYLGLRKAAPQKLLQNIQVMLEGYIGLLSTEELSIVCQGFFKNRQQLNSLIVLQTVTERLKKLLKGDMVDKHILVDFLKVLRHARHEDQGLCESFVMYLKAEFSRQNFPDLIQCAHFAAFFANTRFYDAEVFCVFEKTVHTIIHSALTTHNGVIPSDFVLKTRLKGNKDSCKPLESIRMKDVARILWSFSEVLHYPSNADVIKEVVAYITWYWKNKRFCLFQVELFVDCLHSLVIMGVFPNDLHEWIMHLEQLKSSFSQPIIQKVLVIRESMKIEKLSCWRSSPPYDVYSTETFHPYYNLCKVRDIVAELCNDDETLYRCALLLPHIRIPGLELQLDIHGRLSSIEVSKNVVQNHRTPVAVEVLEDMRCLHGSCQPVGLWSMKIRQLKKLGYKVVKIYPEHVAHLEELSTENKHRWFMQHLLESLGGRV